MTVLITLLCALPSVALSYYFLKAPYTKPKEFKGLGMKPDGWVLFLLCLASQPR